MADNKEIAVLAKKIYELSILPVATLDNRKWEALLILNAVYSSATPKGIEQANADKEARWGDAIRQEGLLSRMHPKWHLRTDDGKPPAARFALESALTNNTRDLQARLTTLQLIAPADRPSLDDLARALIADAFNGARGDRRGTLNHLAGQPLPGPCRPVEPHSRALPRGPVGRQRRPAPDHHEAHHDPLKGRDPRGPRGLAGARAVAVWSPRSG